MDYKNNADILSWKRVIQNLQDRTDEGVKEYNEAQEKVTEAVGEFAEPIYDLIDMHFEGDCQPVFDDLVRYLSGDQIADFVEDFRRNHDLPMGDDMDENVKEEKVTEESDEDLINKVAMWIYHESDSPISEIEHLLKKSGEVGEYMDAVSENKEKVTEGTWSIPDTPEKVRELKDLMKQELPADEAQDKIYGILGDDELFDDIAEMEEKDPKADVRGMIVRRLDDLGLLKKKVNETTEALTEEQFDEAAGEKDACYHKVKARYKIWPSAYASGALTQCRKKGAKNWGNSKK